MRLFEEGLKLLRESNELPQGYGVLATELDGEGFDEQEEINVGLQKRGYRIQLPSMVWQPRTEQWAQGLFAMSTILAI